MPRRGRPRKYITLRIDTLLSDLAWAIVRYEDAKQVYLESLLHGLIDQTDLDQQVADKKQWLQDMGYIDKGYYWEYSKEHDTTIK